MPGILLNGIAFVINLLLNAVQLLVIGSIVISWVGGDPGNPVVQMIHSITEPLYRPIRKFTGRIPGPMDWAPFVLVLIVVFLQKTLVPYLQFMSLSGRMP